MSGGSDLGRRPSLIRKLNVDSLVAWAIVPSCWLLIFGLLR